MDHPVIAFIGSGNMATSLIGGLVANQYPPDKIWATNPDKEKLEWLQSQFHIHTTSDNREAAEQADLWVFSVKPAVLKSVVSELADLLKQKQPLILSVVAGITSDSILKWANYPHLSIVRCMPNTPALLGCGCTGLWGNSLVNHEQKAIAESILRVVGVTLWFEKEVDLNAVTAVSGSGPAYFFLVMEAMLDCAKQMGLTEQQAELLTVNTALGAARMALESGKDVATLRKQVTSPGGTTEQAINVLEAGGIRSLFLNALTAAKDRAIEISKLLD
jgi:pyrroline-5-carboxylate reductase